ncbi:PAS domain S-box protein [Natronomonas gomsonensis]|uniref:PAS domain-containing sensor histidine kinase n=1 Tax=Natronomonas gomsonensis TaxID=1046043 RepID=UPI0020CA9BAD|nr:PAS domain S-box protein [Natronomonas gomsonensis]MCY4730194.1 PAS domain S-box protein [Natronomonas gomsonensis]
MAEDSRGDNHSPGDRAGGVPPNDDPGTSIDSTAYETIFNAVEDAVFIFDVTHDDAEVTFRFRANNQAHESITGMTTEDYRGQTPQDLFDDEQAADVLDEYRTCVERKETIEYEETLEHPSGTIEWQTKLTPITEDGTVTRIVGIARDITDRKERERELERYRDVLGKAQTIANIGAWEADLRREESWTTEQINEIYGLPPDEEIGIGEGIDYFHPDDRPIIEEAFERAVETGEPYDLELRVEGEDGERRWVRAQADPYLEDGEAVRIRGTFQDITERKERERELERSRRRLQALFEQAPDAIFIHNERGEILDVNTQAVESLGYDYEKLCSMEVTDIEVTHREELDETWQGMDTGEMVKKEGMQRRKDESTFPVDVWVTKLELPEGIRYLALARDTSERKQYEQQLKEQRDNLQLLNEVVRHDIRNDLTVVKGYAELLADHVDEDAETELTTVQQKAEEAIELTKTARDLANVMLQSEAEKQQMSLSHALENQVEETRTGDSVSIVTIDGSIPDVSVRADNMLDAVFRNLLQNAIQHNDKDVPRVAVTAEETDTSVRVRIADNGPGVPDSRKDEIFARGEKGLESAGSGLGLYLVKTLVDRYGGDVWVEDAEPEGAVFVVELPIAD